MLVSSRLPSVCNNHNPSLTSPFLIDITNFVKKAFYAVNGHHRAQSAIIGIFILPFNSSAVRCAACYCIIIELYQLKNEKKRPKTTKVYGNLKAKKQPKITQDRITRKKVSEPMKMKH
jgi:hypothetical protein